MRTREFLEQVNHNELVKAIAEAEKKTSGELRVFISHKPVKAPLAAAQAHFRSLGMNKTRVRNGVLIFVAPRTRKFAIIGDTAVHARCGDVFWRELADEMTRHFKDSHFQHGILHAIRKAGDLLAEHFPRRPDDKNELPDELCGD